MTNETKAISVALPLALYEKLQAITEATHRSMSEQIRYWIDTAQVESNE